MNRSTKKLQRRDDNDVGYVGDSAPEKLSLTRPAPLVSYFGDGVLGAPGNGHSERCGRGRFINACAWQHGGAQ